MRFPTTNPSPFLWTILLVVETYTLLHQIPMVLAVGTDASLTTANCDLSLLAPIVLPCPEPDHLKMSYVSGGSVDCGGALSLDQAAIAPSIRADSSIVDKDGLYSLILVDTTTYTTTTNTFFAFDTGHPILHYGAVNIQGSMLLQGLSLDRTDPLDVFSAYRGPNLPKPNSVGANPAVDQALFAYEYMLGAQTNGPIAVPDLAEDGVFGFDYETFFDETVGLGFSNLASSTHFVSGWCVEELPPPVLSGRQDPTEAPSAAPSEAPTANVPDPTEAPTVASTAMPMMTSAVEAQSIGETEVVTQSPSGAPTSSPTDAPMSGGSRSLSVSTMGTLGLDVLGAVATAWIFHFI